MNSESLALEVDVRGLVCPEPVVRTRAALEANPGKTVRVITGSPEARANIARFAQSRGYEVSYSEAGPGIYVVELKPGKSQEPQRIPASSVVLISSEGFGSGSEKLGRLLMQLFLRSLCEVEPRPSQPLLVHGGVKLAVEGSAVLDVLRKLEELGVTIRVCGTCLDYYGLKEQVRIGLVSNMFELAEIMMSGTQVVRI
ncbi:MAG: sulfurtransferase-like selenium metabolism protein YedF [candidate division WOR-3 bacterium]